MGNDIYFHKNFTGGFIVAMTGIVLISFNGQNLELNPLGDLLAIIAALVCMGILFYIDKENQ